MIMPAALAGGTKRNRKTKERPFGPLLKSRNICNARSVYHLRATEATSICAV